MSAMKRKIEIGEVTAQVRQGGIAAHYEYAPFGEVTAQVRQGGVTDYDFAALNPWRFSSEYADDASATVYYNYRHYEPTMGRWMSRDLVLRDGSPELLFCNNFPGWIDVLGLYFMWYSAEDTILHTKNKIPYDWELKCEKDHSADTKKGSKNNLITLNGVFGARNETT